MTERPTLPGPDSPHPEGGAFDPLAELLALVTERARLLNAPDAGEPGMAALKEAVDALGRYLDSLELLREARDRRTGGSGRAAPGDAAGEVPPPPDPVRASPPGPERPTATTAGPAAPAAAATSVEPPASPAESADEGERPVPAESSPGSLTERPTPMEADRRPEAPDAPQAAARSEEPPTPADSGGPAPERPAAPEPETAAWTGGAEPAPADGSESTGGTRSDRDFPPFRDQLTGLHSREGFDAIASGELKRCRRHGRVFSMLLFELAGLDEGGLSRAAGAILASIRESDLAGRRDARVLSVALPETSGTEARIVAERILRRFEGTGAWGSWARLALVTHPTHGETLRHLLDASRVQLTLPTQRVLASAENGHWPA